jgi:hypothetical protein
MRFRTSPEHRLAVEQALISAEQEAERERERLQDYRERVAPIRRAGGTDSSAGHSSDARRYDAFICHASKDKDSVARPLFEGLSARGYGIWYDEISVRTGDSLRESIAHGLSSSKFGVVVLSPNFFAAGWSQFELNALVARHTAGERCILPVWHNVTAEEIRAKDVLLADLRASSTAAGIPAVVDDLAAVMGPPAGNPDSLRSGVGKQTRRQNPPPRPRSRGRVGKPTGGQNPSPRPEARLRRRGFMSSGAGRTAARIGHSVAVKTLISRKELQAIHHMSASGVWQHVHLLKDAGVVSPNEVQVGRQRHAQLDAGLAIVAGISVGHRQVQMTVTDAQYSPLGGDGGIRPLPGYGAMSHQYVVDRWATDTDLRGTLQRAAEELQRSVVEWAFGQGAHQV